MRTGLIIAALLLVAGTAPQAGAGRASQQIWGIGATAWLCYEPPCGWRGIFPVDDEGTRGPPLSILDQPEPPAMRGKPRDLDRIRASYADHGCTLVQGYFSGGVLIVLHLIGDCHQP